MVLRRVAFKPLCRQCGHKFERPMARCPMCGFRTGIVQPIQAPLRPAIDDRPAVEVVAETGLDDEMDDVVLAPPVERTAATPHSIEMNRQFDEDNDEPTSEPAPIARRVSLSSLILGTALVAICLGLGRVSLAAGIIALLVLIPAFVRTLSGISYYRDHGRQLNHHDVGAILAVSLVLSLMGLAAAGLVFLATAFASGFVVRFLPPDSQLAATTILGTTAAFVTVFVLVHRVWPVNED